MSKIRTKLLIYINLPANIITFPIKMEVSQGLPPWVKQQVRPMIY